MDLIPFASAMTQKLGTSISLQGCSKAETQSKSQMTPVKQLSKLRKIKFEEHINVNKETLRKIRCTYNKSSCAGAY